MIANFHDSVKNHCYDRGKGCTSNLEVQPSWGIVFYLDFVLTSITACAGKERLKLKVVQTSDIHGNYYPYDFIRRREATGSLARVHSFGAKRT